MMVVAWSLVAATLSLISSLSFLQPPKKKTRENLRELDQHVKARRIAFKEKQLQARRAKDAFDSVKKQRLKLFSECFSFVSDRIDNLFKVCVCVSP